MGVRTQSPPKTGSDKHPKTGASNRLETTTGESAVSQAAIRLQAPPRRFLAIIFVCFFLSGAAGLIYQVAWGKALGLVFGHTAYAVATVLAVFMGGLAAGSAWLSRWGDRWSRPLALYAWLEVGTALTGALSLAGLAGVRTAYFAAYPYAAAHDSILLLLRFAGAVLVLFLPTFLMGGTLPILVRAVTRSSAELGKRLARLYWVNTAGAVAGTIAAGFLLLPTIGLRATFEIAVGLNLLAAALALLLTRKNEVAARAPRRGRARARTSLPKGCCRAAARNATASSPVFCRSWRHRNGLRGWLDPPARHSARQLDVRVHLDAGDVFDRHRAGQRSVRMVDAALSSRRSVFALTQTLTALTSLACLLAFPFLPQLLPMILKATHESFRGLVLAQLAIAALAMLPVAVVFGFNFPVVTLLVAGPQGQRFGRGRPRLCLEHSRRNRRRGHRRLLPSAGARKLSNACRDGWRQSGSRDAALRDRVAPPRSRQCAERCPSGRSRGRRLLALLL